MLLGVVSDTHGDCHATLLAARLLESLEAEMLIHCGDVGRADVVATLAAWPAHFVLGNVDHAGELEAAVRRAGKTFHGRFGSLELDGKRVAFLHGDDGRRLRETIQSGRWDLVCHGHTHEPSSERRGSTLVLNPGAVSRTCQPALAVVELPSLRVTPVSL